MLGGGWTDEQVTQLRDLAGQGLSASAIGRRIDVSRNAVIGKARRLKIALTGPLPTVAKFPKPSRPRPVPADRRKPVSVAIAAETPKPSPPPASAVVPVIADIGPPLHLTIGRLKSDSCRFPLWADDASPTVDDAKYCGRPAVAGKSWCSACLPRVSGGFVARAEIKKAEAIARR